MFTYIYGLPLWKMISIVLVSTILWIIIGTKWKRMHRYISMVLLLTGFFAILYATLLKRSHGEYSLSLVPFITLRNAATQPEYYRTLLLNVLMFLPFGLGLAGVLPQRWELRYRMMIVVIAGTLFSISIESLQYYFHLGEAETDDVLMNATGTVAAAVALYTKEKLQNLLSG